MNSKYTETVEFLLDLGECILLCGSEITRVEDSIHRMGNILGAKKCDVFAITSLLIVTVTFSDEEILTQTRRINKSACTDYIILEKLNSLIREGARSNISLDDAKTELEKIKNYNSDNKKICIGNIIAAASFAVFFGGNIPDGIIAGFFGMVIYYLKKHISSKIPNDIIFSFISSALIGLCIYPLTNLIPALHSDKILIGDIMLLIPGIAITNSVRDMLAGNMISGLIKFTESILQTGSLVLGFMFAMFITGV